ncbi:nuclear transport factor 2 family protein [Methyloraptor flagellatus]|uniref:Nuclear transport factor 2 family protein n=1 Tax=Methyloraptor flagellatus TaxID=3162530 RepID=A0AAU7XE97_9HYPH
MPFALPEPIADYFAADASDPVAVAKCFTADAVVIDEKRTHTGREAIAAWKAAASAKYDYTATPIAVEDQSGRLVVTAHVAGTFPGSPVDLRYAFTLSDDLIARLEIVP